MTQQQQATTLRVIRFEPQQPIGGAVIDAEGREVQITEYMIRRACSELEKSFDGNAQHA